MASFRELEVYQRAQELFPKVYALVRNWNQLDQRELGSQMIRAANSIHANIAEGHAKSTLDFKRYISISLGSCDEICGHLKDAANIGLVSLERSRELANEYEIVGKQLTRLKQSLPLTRN
ncbi:four helix bundle protein [Candidatus Kaiserbacteria bacterium]|nr:four helix bundle protein [Candidatus Kaiserbacteria bacterium]